MSHKKWYILSNEFLTNFVEVLYGSLVHSNKVCENISEILESHASFTEITHPFYKKKLELLQKYFQIFRSMEVSEISDFVSAASFNVSWKSFADSAIEEEPGIAGVILDKSTFHLESGDSKAIFVTTFVVSVPHHEKIYTVRFFESTEESEFSYNTLDTIKLKKFKLFPFLNRIDMESYREMDRADIINWYDLHFMKFYLKDALILKDSFKLDEFVTEPEGNFLCRYFITVIEIDDILMDFYTEKVFLTTSNPNFEFIMTLKDFRESFGELGEEEFLERYGKVFQVLCCIPFRGKQGVIRHIRKPENKEMLEFENAVAVLNFKRKISSEEFKSKFFVSAKKPLYQHNNSFVFLPVFLDNPVLLDLSLSDMSQQVILMKLLSIDTAVPLPRKISLLRKLKFLFEIHPEYKIKYRGEKLDYRSADRLEQELSEFWINKFMGQFKEFLENKGYDVRIDSNDLIIFGGLNAARITADGTLLADSGFFEKEITERLNEFRIKRKLAN